MNPVDDKPAGGDYSAVLKLSATFEIIAPQDELHAASAWRVGCG